MKKILILFTMAIMVSTYSFSQVRPKIGGAKADSVAFKDDNWTSWATGISDALAGNSTKKLVTEYAVKTFLLGFSPLSIKTSVDSLADTTYRHLIRINALYGLYHSHTNKAILDATTSSFVAAQATAISTATATNNTQGDSLVAHNNRIKTIKDTVISHNTRLKLLKDTAISHNTRLKKLKDTTTLHNTRLIALENGSTGISDHLTDTLWFDYLDGAGTGKRFIVLTSTGGADSGVLTNSSKQFVMFLSPLKKYLKDIKNGELAGYYTKNGKLVKNYGLKDNETGQSLGLEAIEILLGHAERAYRFIFRRVIVDNIQWSLIVVLLIWVARLEIKSYRK